MIFLKISAFYPDFLSSAYKKSPEVAVLPYSDQMEFLFSFCFAMADFWKKNLEKTGKFTVHEIVLNAEIAQKKWASENAFLFSEANWKMEILEAQIAHYRPEVIFFQDYGKPPIWYKQNFPFVKYIISWDGLANMDVLKYAGSDMIASCHKYTVDFYRQKGISSYLFHFGFERELNKRLLHRVPAYEFSFVGSASGGKRAHNERIHFLSELSKELPVNYWLNAIGRTDLFSRAQIKRIIRGEIAQIFELQRLEKINNGSVFGLEMLQVLADSKVTFNSHIDASGTIAANLRLFEATGAGTCLLTDWKVNLHEIFDVDKEVVAYKSLGECVEKARWLLNNEKERSKIAAAGQQRTFTDYSMEARILQFFKYMKLM